MNRKDFRPSNNSEKETNKQSYYLSEDKKKLYKINKDNSATPLKMSSYYITDDGRVFKYGKDNSITPKGLWKKKPRKFIRY